MLISRLRQLTKYQFPGHSFKYNFINLNVILSMLSLADDDVDFLPPLLLAAHCYYIKGMHEYQSVLINDEFPPWSLKTTL